MIWTEKEKGAAADEGEDAVDEENPVVIVNATAARYMARAVTDECTDAGTKAL